MPGTNIFVKNIWKILFILYVFIEKKNLFRFYFGKNGVIFMNKIGSILKFLIFGGCFHLTIFIDNNNLM